MEPTVSPLSVIDDVTCDQRKRVVVVRKSFEARRIQSAQRGNVGHQPQASGTEPEGVCQTQTDAFTLSIPYIPRVGRNGQRGSCLRLGGGDLYIESPAANVSWLQAPSRRSHLFVACLMSARILDCHGCLCADFVVHAMHCDRPCGSSSAVLAPTECAHAWPRRVTH